MPSLVILHQALESEEPPKQEVIVTGLKDYHLMKGDTTESKNKQSKQKSKNGLSKGIFKVKQMMRLQKHEQSSKESLSLASTASACTFTLEEQDEEQAMAMISPPITIKQKKKKKKKDNPPTTTTRSLGGRQLDDQHPTTSTSLRSRSQPCVSSPQQRTDPGEDQPDKNSNKKNSNKSSSTTSNNKNNSKSSAPNPGAYSNNHLMVNRERVVRGLSVLKRCHDLDARSTSHAVDLADDLRLGHSVANLEELQLALKSPNVGENVFSGNSIREMHAGAMLEGTSSRFNILRPSYTDFGMGTAVGDDGRLYMVQLFRGGEREEL